MYVASESEMSNSHRLPAWSAPALATVPIPKATDEAAAVETRQPRRPERLRPSFFSLVLRNPLAILSIHASI